MEKIQLFAFADEADKCVDGQILAMKRNGLCGLEIRGVDGVNVAKITPDKAREVRKKMDDNGLVTWSIGSPIGKINIETDDFEAHLEKFKHTLEVAKILGAENIRLFSFYMPKDKDPEAYRDEVIRRLKCFVKLASGTGITLCHENEKGIYGDMADRCLEIHKTVPELKAIFDPANYVQCGQDTLQGWELVKPYVKYMHIKDATAEGKVVPAGKGDGNVAASLKDFQSQGGDALTIEPHLKVFAGLAALEREGDTSEVGQFVYPTNDAAFDAACNALKEIL